MKIIIGGGTGFIGNYLKSFLEKGNNKILIISRIKRNKEYLTWDEVKLNGLPECDAIINLAGENLMNVFSRWNESFQNKLYNSRIDTTKLLVNSIIKSHIKPKVWISSSAIGYYPASPNKVYTEDSLGGSGDFLAEMCNDWEKAAMLPPHIQHVRHSTIRIGLVLGKDGGMLGNMKIPFSLGLGGRLGNGKQMMSWVHIHDLAAIFNHVLINPNISGVLNGVAPNCVTNQEFTLAYAKAIGRPALFPVPPMVLKYLYGSQRADVILNALKVIPKRTLETGFTFKYPTIDLACKEILS